MTVERHALDVPGGRLCLVLHLPEVATPVPCIVACHGLGASKDSDKYLLLGAELPMAGFALARFDFRGCGESSGREEDTTIATRIEDVEAVLARLAADSRLSGGFGLLGSSMGGFVALHVAARAQGQAVEAPRGSRHRPRVKAVVTWNAPSDLRELGSDEHRDARGLGVPFFLELATHVYESTPVGVGRHLIVQGEADDVVPVKHGTILHARAGEPCEIVIIPGADHRLTDPAHRGEAIAASVAWFRQLLHQGIPNGRDPAPLSETSA